MFAENSINMETEELTNVNGMEVKEQMNNYKEGESVNNDNIDNVNETDENDNVDESVSVEITGDVTDHASTVMKGHKTKRRAALDKANKNAKTSAKSKATSSSSNASTRMPNRPRYNIAGVNIGALIQSMNNSTDANGGGAREGNLLYNRKMRRVRRRSSILEDHPAFIAHRQLRETWENARADNKSLVSSTKNTGEHTEEHSIPKQKFKHQHQQQSETKLSNASQSRQHYTELRHLRNTFTAAPFASAVDVLNSLTEWRDSPSLVYAELLWNYAPEAAKEMIAFDMNNMKVKRGQETSAHVEGITMNTDTAATNYKIGKADPAITVIKHEKDNEDDDYIN